VLVVPIAEDAHARLKGTIHWRPEERHAVEETEQLLALKAS
jgi:hypothetical protein